MQVDCTHQVAERICSIVKQHADFTRQMSLGLGGGGGGGVSGGGMHCVLRRWVEHVSSGVGVGFRQEEELDLATFLLCAPA
jgi:hypothetical protein